MFCSNCGSKLQEGYKFCNNCGAAVNEPENHVEPERHVESESHFEAERSVNNVEINTQMSSETGESSAKKKISGKQWTVLAIGLSLIVALVCAGVYIFNSQSNNSASNKNTSTNQVAENSKKPDKKEVFVYRENGDPSSNLRSGLIDTDLQVILKPIYSNITPFSEDGVALATIPSDGSDQTVLINQKGEEISKVFDTINVQSDQFYWHEYLSENNVFVYRAKRGTSELGLMNTKGEIVKEPVDWSIPNFNGNNITTFTTNQKTGILSETGEIVIEPTYYSLQVINNQYILAKKEDQNAYDVIDREGNIVKENFSLKDTWTYSSGLIEYTGLNGKYGIVDSNLNEIIPPTLPVIPQVTDDGKFIFFTGNSEVAPFIYTADGKQILQDFSPNFIGVPDAKNRFTYVKGSEIGLITDTGKIVFTYDTGNSNEHCAFEQEIGMNFYTYTNGDDEYSLNEKGEILEQLNGYKTVRKNEMIRGYKIMYNPNQADDLIYVGMNGDILTESPFGYSDAGKYFFYQKDGEGFIVDKTNGKEIKHATIE